MQRTLSTVLVIALTVSAAIPLDAQETAGPFRPKEAPITLEQARQMAVQTHPEIRNIDETVTRADLLVTQAWSVLLPNVDVQGSVVLNQNETTLEFPDFATFDPANPATMETNEMIIQEKWGRNLGFQANMTLFNPRAIPLIRNARENSELTRITARRKKNDLIYAVTAAYYQAHSMTEMVTVAQENLTLATLFLKQAEARQVAGQITGLDVLRAEMQVTESEKRLDDARDAAELARTALAYLIGREGPFTITGPGPVDDDLAGLDQLKSQALKKRLELKEATIAKRMSKRNETETWMKWLPSFDVTYDWSFSSSEGFSGENTNWRVIFGARWSLFEGGGRIAELKSRQSLSRTSQNQIDQLTLAIKEAVEKSYIRANMKKRNVTLAEKQVALAEQNHTLVGKQYDVGLVTSLDMLASATDLSDKRIKQVLDRLQYDLALLTLQRDLGEYHSLSAQVSP